MAGRQACLSYPELVDVFKKLLLHLPCSNSRRLLTLVYLSLPRTRLWQHQQPWPILEMVNNKEEQQIPPEYSRVVETDSLMSALSIEEMVSAPAPYQQ